MNKNKKTDELRKSSLSRLTRTQKIILASLGVLICLLIIFVIYKQNLSTKVVPDENLRVLFDIERPIIVSKANKYGYILDSKEELLEPTFDIAKPFWNGYAVVSKGDKKYEIIDKKGTTKLKVESSLEPEYLKECGRWLIDNRLYDRDLKLIYEDDASIKYLGHGYFTYLSNSKKESGIVNSDGKKTFTWDSEYITASISTKNDEYGELYALVSDFEEKEQIVNLKTGKKYYEIKNPDEKYIRQESNNIFRIINRQQSYKTEKWLYIKDEQLKFTSDEEIYSLEVESIIEDILKIDYGQNYKELKKETRYVYYDVKNGKYTKDNPVGDVTPALFKEHFNYRLTVKDDKWGLKIKDEEMIEAKYDKISFLDYNLHKYLYEFQNVEYALLESDSKTILYDIKKNRQIDEFPSSSYSQTKDSSFLLFTLYEPNGYTKKSHLIYNVITNKSLELDKNKEYEIFSNYVTVKTGEGKTVYYNAELEKIYEEVS